MTQLPRTAPTGLAIAAIATGRAIQVNYGSYSPEALVWLTIALAACFLAVVSPRVPFPEGGELRALTWVLVCGIFVQFLQYPFYPPARYLHKTGRSLAPFLAGILAAAALSGLLLSRRSRVRAAVFTTILAIHLLLGVWIIREVPEPRIDVFTFHQGAAALLLNGTNPYSANFPDVYDSHESAQFNPTGMSRDGWLTFGFIYPPLSLLLSVTGYALFGDYRYAHLAAIEIAASLIAFLKPGRVPILAAVLFLYTPRVFFVVEQGWTEPLAAMLFALLLFVSVRGVRWIALPLGLTIGVKQHLFPLLVPASLLLPRPFSWAKYRRTAAAALLVAIVTAAPFVLWDGRALVRNLIILQLRNPFRPDALSYPALCANLWNWQPPAWIAFAAAAAAAVFGVRRGSPGPQGFATVAALMYLVFFAFSKQAFCNYYFFVIGLLCCAVASTTTSPPPDDTAHTPPANPTPPAAR